MEQNDPVLNKHNHQTLVTPGRFDCCVFTKFGANSLLGGWPLLTDGTPMFCHKTYNTCIL